MHKLKVKKLEVLTRILLLLEQQQKQQKDLADFLGINRNNITDWKSGKSKSYNKYLYQIATYLNTTPEYLKGETDIKEKPVADDELSQNNVKFIGRNGTVIYKRVSPEFIKILESIPDTDEDL